MPDRGRIILDAGPLIAMFNRRDQHHVWATRTADEFSRPFLSCDAVLGEAHFILRGIPLGNRRLNEFLEAGRIDVVFSSGGHAARVGKLMSDYHDQPMSFADACLVRMAELHEGASIFTVDSQFRIYRKHGNRALDLIIP